MTKKPEVKPEVKTEVAPEVAPEVETEVETEVTPEVETEKVLNGQVWNERKLNNGLTVLTRVS